MILVMFAILAGGLGEDGHDVDDGTHELRVDNPIDGDLVGLATACDNEEVFLLATELAPKATAREHPRVTPRLAGGPGFSFGGPDVFWTFVAAGTVPTNVLRDVLDSEGVAKYQLLYGTVMTGKPTVPPELLDEDCLWDGRTLLQGEMDGCLYEDGPNLVSVGRMEVPIPVTYGNSKIQKKWISKKIGDFLNEDHGYFYTHTVFTVSDHLMSDMDDHLDLVCPFSDA
jgi:hypothetical protein